MREPLHRALAQERGGDGAGAATTFAELAANAHTHGFAVPATRFQVRATLAGYRADANAEAAVAAGTLAATYAVGMPIRRRAVRLLAKIVHQLEQDGHGAQAQALAAAVKAALEVSTLKGGDPVPVNRAQRRLLPKACGTCGTPVDAAEVEFDEDGADCPACGGGLL